MNYRRLDWIISCFSVTVGDAPEAYNYSLSQTPAGYYAWVDDTGKVLIEDGNAQEPLFKVDEVVNLVKGDLVNLTTDVKTTYGQILANVILLSDSFGEKIPYINKEFSVQDIEDILTKSFFDDPERVEDKQSDKFYVSEYKRFHDACFFLTGLTQLFTWAATEKNILPPDGIAQYKAQLLEQYKDNLDDPVIIAKIESLLVEFDAKWRQGDPGNRFLISKKSTALVRKQKVLMYGAETISTGDGSKLELHKNSLYEGWQPESFTTMCTTARFKSYARGAETALGGVEVKWLLRASGNINVTVDDCGSKIGVSRRITEANVKSLVGFNIITPKGPRTIESEEDLGSYLGSIVMVRSPMYCNLDHTDYCKVCIGPKLSTTPYALSSAVSAYGSAFLLSSLGAAHSKAIDVATMDLATDLQ